MILPEQRTTETMDESQSREQYSEILDRVQRDEEQVIIEKNGVPVAAIVPMSVVRDAKIAENRRNKALAALERIQQGFADIPEDELDREVVNAVAEVKAEYRSERASRSIESQ